MSLVRDLQEADRKILILDTERFPNLGYWWDAHGEHQCPDMLVREASVVCWGGKWVGRKPIMFASEFHHGRDEMLQRVWNVFHRADIVVTYNGLKADVPWLQWEWEKAHLGPPSPWKNVDLYQVVKRKFGATFKGMNHVLRMLELEQKQEHEGIGMWLKCMAGDRQAWSRMKRYQINDVRVTEQLYLQILPWIHNHPHTVNDATHLRCNKCGSDDLQPYGTYLATVHLYQQYWCRGCRGWMRAGHLKRVAQTMGVR